MIAKVSSISFARLSFTYNSMLNSAFVYAILKMAALWTENSSDFLQLLLLSKINSHYCLLFTVMFTVFAMFLVLVKKQKQGEGIAFLRVWILVTLAQSHTSRQSQSIFLPRMICKYVHNSV